MGSTARRYFPRAPRYVLRPLDNALLRFKGMHTHGSITNASVRDISESGLSFTLDSTETPEIDEIVKVEFTIPGRRQIACFATVTRIETDSEWDPARPGTEGMRVGIRFHNLPPAHLRALQTSLAERTTPEEKDVIIEDARDIPLGLVLRLSLAVVGLIALFACMTIPPSRILAFFGG